MWQVKDEYSNKIYLETNNMSLAVKWANNYNETKNLQTQNIKISWLTKLIKWDREIDINGQYVIDSLFERRKIKAPLGNKDYPKTHQKYLDKKKELVLKLCKKNHVWPYHKRDGHKLCGFDW